MSTPQDTITTARYLINDTDAISPRQSDAELLGYFNDGLRELSSLRPDLFQTIGDYTCIAGQCDQQITFPDAQGIAQVLSIHSGAALTPFDIPTMDAFNPSWRADTAAAATQWSRFASDPLRFYIYPKAPVTLQTLDVLYIKNPAALLVGDTITEVPSGMIPALVDYVVYRAMSKDDEHSNSGRAAASLTAFVSKVKGA